MTDQDQISDTQAKINWETSDTKTTFEDASDRFSKNMSIAAEKTYDFIHPIIEKTKETFSSRSDQIKDGFSSGAETMKDEYATGPENEHLNEPIHLERNTQYEVVAANEPEHNPSYTHTDESLHTVTIDNPTRNTQYKVVETNEQPSYNHTEPLHTVSMSKPANPTQHIVVAVNDPPSHYHHVDESGRAAVDKVREFVHEETEKTKRSGQAAIDEISECAERTAEDARRAEEALRLKAQQVEVEFKERTA